jgi:hypothetical protein
MRVIHGPNFVGGPVGAVLERVDYNLIEIRSPSSLTSK